MGLTITIIFFVIIIIIFSSKSFSPIPYFPSQPVDMPLIVKALCLKHNQTIIDLGAGDGIVIFNAASESFRRKLNTKFIAVEINPILILVLYFRRLFHKNRNNITIIYNDIFKMNFSSLVPSPQSLTVYLYVSPWLIEKIISNVKKQLKKFLIVTYFYPIISMQKNERIIQGKNKIFVYK
jgi:hypothetical protein